MIDVGCTYCTGEKFSLHTMYDGMIVDPSLDVRNMGRMINRALNQLRERCVVEEWPPLLYALCECMMDEDPTSRPTLEDVKHLLLKVQTKF